MKSYFLEGLADDSAARQALSNSLPGQIDPWLVLTDDGSDVIAYVNVDTGDHDLRGPFVVTVDISGRHYNEDQKIIDLLRSLKARLGGGIRDDSDRELL